MRGVKVGGEGFMHQRREFEKHIDGVVWVFVFQNSTMMRVRELQALVAPKHPQGVSVPVHAGRVINRQNKSTRKRRTHIPLRIQEDVLVQEDGCCFCT